MEYLEWLQQPEISLANWLQEETKPTAKKILIVNRVKGAEHLVSKYIASQGPVVNLQTKSLTAVAKAAMDKMYAGKLQITKTQNEDVESYMFYDHTMSVALVEDLLQVICAEILDFYIPVESICLDTAREVYAMMNQIRMGARKEIPVNNDEERKEAALRYEQLEKLIDKYEKALVYNFAYDKVSLIKKVLDDGMDYVENAEFAVLMPQELTALEQQFLYAISKGNAKKIAYLKPFRAKTCFARAYGVQNEVAFVVQDILDKERKLGDVAILYTSTAQENFIRSVLGGVVDKNSARLPYSFITGCSVATSDFVQLLNKILDWVENQYRDDMSYILESSGCILFASCKKEELTAREYEKAKAELLHKAQEEIKNIFMPLEGNSQIVLKDVWDGLIAFLQCYKYEQSAGWAEVAMAFAKESQHLDKMRSAQSLNMAVQILKEELTKLKITQKEEANKISVMKINPRFIMNRKYVYVIGLSSADFSEKLVDSPVLSDTQLRFGLLDQEKGQQVYYISYAAKKEQEKIEKLQDTLATVDGQDAEVTLVYSYFDVLNIRENGPCVFYLEKLEEAGVKLDDVEKFGYTLLEYNQVNDEELTPKKKPEKIEKQDEQVRNMTIQDCVQEEQRCPKKYVSFSASSIQTLLHCPVEYYYRYEKHIKTSETKEAGAYMWLPADEFGTLVHSVLQIYTQNRLQEKSQEHILNQCDEKYLKKLVVTLCAETVKRIPCDVEVIYQNNVREIYNGCKKYLDSLHKDLKTPVKDGIYWSVKECEREFKKQEFAEIDLGACELYTANGKKMAKEMSDAEWDDCLALSYNGKIDRIDHYIDENGVEHIRVIDYKSGRYATLVEKLENNELVQHIIYTKLLLSDSDVVIDDFYYIFPFDDELSLRITFDQKVLANDPKAKPLSKDFANKVQDLVYHSLINQHFSREDAMTWSDDFGPADQIKTKEKICQYCPYKIICKEEVGKQL